MKRLAMATVVLTALATLAQAGGLPKPLKMGERMKNFDTTHYVRGAEPGRSHGYESPSTEEEVRGKGDDKKAVKTAKQKDQKPQSPAKAD
jgi:hypothetical protein